MEVNDQLQLQLFPNPASDQCTVSFNIPAKEKEATLSVFDLEGRKMREEKISSTQHTVVLPLQNFASGVYIIGIRTLYETITKKLVKQ
jgi:hypothetical protein